MISLRDTVIIIAVDMTVNEIGRLILVHQSMKTLKSHVRDRLEIVQTERRRMGQQYS